MHSRTPHPEHSYISLRAPLVMTLDLNSSLFAVLCSCHTMWSFFPPRTLGKLPIVGLKHMLSVPLVGRRQCCRYHLWRHFHLLPCLPFCSCSFPIPIWPLWPLSLWIKQHIPNFLPPFIMGVQVGNSFNFTLFFHHAIRIHDTHLKTPQP